MRSDAFVDQSLWELIATAWRRNRLIILSATIVGGLLTLGTVLAITPIYTAEVALLFYQQPSNVDGEGIAQGSVDSLQKGRLSQSQVAILTSNDLASNVLDNPELRTLLEQDALFSNDIFDLARQTATTIFTYVASIIGLNVTRDTDEYILMRKYMRHLSVIQDPDTYILRVDFDAASPRLAAMVANAHANEYIRMLHKQQVRVLDEGTSWLSDEVYMQRRRLQAADKALEDFRARTGIVTQEPLARPGTVNLSDGQSSADIRLATITQNTAAAEGELAALQARQKDLERLKKAERFDEIAEIFASTVLQGLQERLSDLNGQVASYANDLGPRHPQLVRIHAQQAELQAQETAEIHRITASLASETEIARTKAQQLHVALDDLKNERLAEDPNRSELRRLLQEADSERARYDAVLQKQRAYDRARDLAQAGATVVSQAIPPDKAVWPSKLLFLVFGSCFAGGAALASTIWRQSTRNVAQTAQDIKDLLQVPCLAVLPEVKTQSSGTLDRSTAAYACYQEGLRLVEAHFTRDYDLVGEDPCYVLMIASSLPNEGKSTFSCELGRFVSQSGKRCLVVSADPLDQDPKRNSTPALADPCTLDNPPSCVSFSIPHGMQHDGQTLFQRLGEWRRIYDLIIVDMPPVSAAADAFLLAPLVDSTILLVRLDHTPLALIRTTAEHIERRGAIPLLGTVATFANPQRRRGVTPSDFTYYFADNYKYYSPRPRATAPAELLPALPDGGK